MWSVEDTAQPTISVAYGTSKSPLGPIEVAKGSYRPDSGPPQHEIYGTAHNSVTRSQAQMSGTSFIIASTRIISISSQVFTVRFASTSWNSMQIWVLIKLKQPTHGGIQ